MPKSILIVDDDAMMRSFLSTVMREEGYAVEEAGNGSRALEALRRSEFDLVVTDLRMPDVSGMEVMREGRTLRPEARWVIVTAYGSIGNAVEAMKAGASDYMTKPFRDPDELRHVVRRVLREADAETRISLLSEELGKRFPPAETIFLGERMAQVHRLVRDVAPTTATVLVTGQSGTGKDLVARVIHALSPRREKPFVAVQCSALAETVLESELFGHERGAFTGAVGMRKGRFELADGGTVFLDEIGDIAPAVQVKLLRVLQERSFERVGGARPIEVDVRIVAATHRDLKKEVAAGRFREDLYYRLNVFPIVLPPLVDRREAIVALAEYFAGKFAAAFGKKISGFSGEAVGALRQYPWPGNVRELQNVIERAVILASGEIDVGHLRLETATESGMPGGGALRANERETIRKVLAENGGNRTQAARALGISLRTLQYRIKEYGL
ncbi:MAG: sigma-54-dependent Fis family transcriptional regulator [Deltaproteobacteria bacterium]|nr:sigma-54-dependent Fis family transcriptional regulator [Deltaproteobacteria bacterium]